MAYPLVISSGRWGRIFLAIPSVLLLLLGACSTTPRPSSSVPPEIQNLERASSAPLPAPPAPSSPVVRIIPPPASLVVPKPAEIETVSLWQDEFLFAGWRIQRHFYQGHARLLDNHNWVRAVGTSAACRQAFDYFYAQGKLVPRSPHLVLLLHGLGSKPDVMDTLRRRLNADGWDAQTVTYPTTEQGIASNADGVEKILLNLQGYQGYQDVSFVAHSLGGLITRATLSRASFARLPVPVKTVVMLGTPNRGAALAGALHPLARAAVTAAANDLLPERARQIGAIPKGVRFGVIAGGRGGRIGYNPLLLGDNDSIVRTEETKADNMTEWIVLPVFHTTMTTDPACIEAVRRFLKGGTLRE